MYLLLVVLSNLLKNKEEPVCPFPVIDLITEVSNVQCTCTLSCSLPLIL